MTILDIQAEILRLKKERDICIIAHAYQGQEILEVADFVGDSYGLSIEASRAPQQSILMCGVRFMAETAKVLSPEKRVYLANADAGCPMADQMDKAMIESVKTDYPGHAVVCYINTTSELKTVCDVCVTSSSAVEICKKLPQKDILFIPDQNLAQYVADKLPEKNVRYLDGGCPYHAAMTVLDVERARAAHPGALFLVHPECPPEVAALADYVGSTTGIMAYAQDSSAESFIIGTEISIVEHLQFSQPDKKFYHLSGALLCPEMKKTTLMDVYHCVNGTGGEEITLSQEVMIGARRCIDEMIRLGG
ncbi:MAG: quinolinate synthetase [Firmicutes bacterium]|nr:quinolinate synthetase [Bacillota bacterium]